MTDPQAAAARQLENIERDTGRAVPAWAGLVADRGLEKHGQIVSWLKSEHGLTHGNANALAHAVRREQSGGEPATDQLLDAQYSGGKAALRPIYEHVVKVAGDLGPDVSVVVQKTGVSLRRGKQFGVVSATSAKRVQLGLNLRGTEPTGRLVAAGGMCTHKVDLTQVTDVDDEVTSWLRSAYDQA